MSCAAPKARNIKARGKREARRPWLIHYVPSGLKGRNILRPVRAGSVLIRAPGASAKRVAPGFHIPRLWRCIFVFLSSGHVGFADVKIRRDLLHVVVIFERFH